MADILSVWGLAAVAAAYLIGSLSFAVIVSKFYGLDDPRSYGSGNPGATNVLRSGRKKAAALTLLGDALKGLVAVLLARWLQSYFGLADEGRQGRGHRAGRAAGLIVAGSADLRGGVADNGLRAENFLTGRTHRHRNQPAGRHVLGATALLASGHCRDCRAGAAAPPQQYPKPAQRQGKQNRLRQIAALPTR